MFEFQIFKFFFGFFIFDQKSVDGNNTRKYFNIFVFPSLVSYVRLHCTVKGITSVYFSSSSRFWQAPDGLACVTLARSNRTSNEKPKRKKPQKIKMSPPDIALYIHFLDEQKSIHLYSQNKLNTHWKLKLGTHLTPFITLQQTPAATIISTDQKKHSGI
jgi:hypothetical protein